MEDPEMRRAQRWAWCGAMVSRGQEPGGGSPGPPCRDLSSWRLPLCWVQCPTTSEPSSAQTSGGAAKPRRCLFAISSFFRTEIYLLLLILQVEWEGRTAFCSPPCSPSPAPSSGCEHPWMLLTGEMPSVGFIWRRPKVGLTTLVGCIGP